ncbi:zeta-crystallin [Poronia punctata]|nr:zeta-crystallin [Poronia punctata]
MSFPKMRAVVIDPFVESYGDIRVSHVPRPRPKRDEILVRVIAAGVNFVDTLYARGKHQNNRRHVKPPFTLGLEFAGIIVSSGESSGFKPGDRVFGDYGGSYAEYISIPSSLWSTLQRIPPGWSFGDAAGLAATLPVSYGALLLCGNLKEGETVLVHAAAGGLGLAAVQIAKAVGARVIGTAGSEGKCRVAEKYGADICINYQENPEWWKQVQTMTGDSGVDLAYDSVGMVNASMKCLAHRGRIMVVGFSGREGNMEDVKMNRILLKQAQVVGYRYGETSRRYPREREVIWHDLYKMIERGVIKPTRFEKEYRGLESVPEALHDIACRKVWGKAVIEVIASEGDQQKAQANL